ncbi:glycoside hydrolase family 43 protein [Sphingomonas sp. LM7]|uniref:glycoside hydrolase family 43 protein n=1 Tax=Sphingomonas sp. LM7 TaxID=1938607 RepID=UPI000983FD50|nr:glycoside hydrolase family 43 protein [Sphingomonas sp. LM7]AQR73665.1 glycoside hydrolase 43 family protein [Sphingomonas sp. LM7]
MRFLASLALLLATPAAAQPVASFDWFEYRGEDPIDRTAKADAGSYRNPILQGFYPDPSVTRVGSDFYLVTSTFSFFPGIPVFHSRDLVSWTQIGNAIDRPDQLDFKQLGLSRGVFAPTIQAKAGIFYILNTCVDCGGNFLITAKNPAGPWSDPIWLPELEGGIDPSLFFDTDGKTWILNNGPPEGAPHYEGHRAIWIQQFDLKARKTVGPRKVLVNGGVDFSKKPIWIEGPHIFRKDGWYYLSCAEGGTAEGHSQVILRSKTVTGPYEANPANPILTQRGLPGDREDPITSAGHAQLVTTPDGKWWATFLAVRPYADDFYSTGRETFLMPVEWEAGWPRITGPGQVIPWRYPRPDLPAQPAATVPTNGGFTVRDTFDDAKLPPYWMMLRNPRSSWFTLEGGAAKLQARPVGLGDNGNPSFLARRQQHQNAVAETVVRFTPEKDGDRAGIAVLQNDEYWFLLGLKRIDGKLALVLDRRDGPDTAAGGETIAAVDAAMYGIAAGKPLGLRIEVRGNRYVFSYARVLGSPDNPMLAWRPLTRLTTDALTTKTAGGFIGSTFGMVAESAKPSSKE